MESNKTAIFIDGAFFIKRALHIFGPTAPDELANKLWSYALKHIYPMHSVKRDKLTKNKKDERDTADFHYALEHLYRIFFYDCPPLDKKMHHPITHECIDFAKSERAMWRLAFHESLREKRKVALRLGNMDNTNCAWTIRPSKIKELYQHKITIDDLCENDYTLITHQKGVDMRIGLDIASVTYKRQASRIILISGDSDFVPAAKLARREGIDFILDPMHAAIKPDLHEHIDGKNSVFPKPKKQSLTTIQS
ncbi:MAG: NYN domain-containing protein [Selenomonas sp.]|nr:NYN domain-containing protein [Selenomonas sp.]